MIIYIHHGFFDTERSPRAPVLSMALLAISWSGLPSNSTTLSQESKAWHCFYQGIAALCITDKIVNCQLLKSSKDWKTSDSIWIILNFWISSATRFRTCELGFINGFVLLPRNRWLFTKTLLNKFWSRQKSSNSTMKRIFCIHLDHSCWGVYVPLEVETLATVPSMIFKRACQLPHQKRLRDRDIVFTLS